MHLVGPETVIYSALMGLLPQSILFVTIHQVNQ